MWVGTFGGGLDLALPDGKGGYIFRHFFNDSYGQKRIRMLVEDRNGWIGAATSAGIYGVMKSDIFCKTVTVICG